MFQRDDCEMCPKRYSGTGLMVNNEHPETPGSRRSHAHSDFISVGLSRVSERIFPDIAG